MLFGSYDESVTLDNNRAVMEYGIGAGRRHRYRLSRSSTR
jgi:hypothetical protein